MIGVAAVTVAGWESALPGAQGPGVTRRGMIAGSLAVIAGLSTPIPALARSTGTPDEAATRYGRVRGRREDGVVKFLGVPYATPPLGELRFKAPQPPSCWRGVPQS